MRRLLATILLLGFSAAAAADFYRWRDEDGNLQMSDRLPPEYAQKEYEIVNNKGRVIKRVERAPTPEEVAAKKAAEEEARRQAKVAKEQARRDRILRLTYGSVEEIKRARDNRIEILEAQTINTEAQIKDKLREQEELEERMAFFEEKEGSVPPGLLRKETRIREELDDLNTRLNRGRAQILELDQRFRADMERYLELEEMKAAGRP